MLSVGLVGLPNVGKSTLFNALTTGRAEVSNYPFTTIDSNMGMVTVPDTRLLDLAAALDPDKVTPCAIQFIDIAGLVEGANRGEGLGNQFLGEIRQVDAIVHVLRSFSDTDVTHVFAGVDPARDAAIVETELLLADLEVLTRAMEKRDRIWRTHPRESAEERTRLTRYLEALEKGQAIRSLNPNRDELAELKSLGLLTGKPVLYVVNVSEDNVSQSEYASQDDDALLLASLESQGTRHSSTLALSAKLEWELLELEPEERGEFMEAMGLEVSGLERLIESAFSLLDLIRFYTAEKNKLQAWEVLAGTKAPQAAGKVHSDMEKGFIRARVAPCHQILSHGSLKEVQRLGLVRTEGKDYVVRDGDLMEFLFSH